MPDLTRNQRVRAWIKADAERIRRDAVAAKVASSLLGEGRVVHLNATVTSAYDHYADSMRYIMRAHQAHVAHMNAEIAELQAERHAA